MCETEDPGRVLDNVDGEEAPMELDTTANVRLMQEASEPFDLYEWALEFSRAAGFEFDPVDPKTGH